MPHSHLLREPGFWHLGSLHPLSHGTNYLNVQAIDNQVEHIQLDLSASSRADEKLLEVREVPQGLALAGRSGWLTAAAAEIAYTQALEQLLGLRPPARAIALRKLLLDVQIILGLSWRLAALADLCGDSASTWLQAREPWLSAHERWTGARIHDIYIRLGGVASDLDAECASNLAELAGLAWPSVQTAAARQQGVLSDEQLAAFNVAGIPETSHDSAARVSHLEQELSSATARVQAQLVKLDDGPVDQLLPKSIRVPVGQAHSRVQSATGWVDVWVIGDGGKAPSRVSYASNSDHAVALFESAAVGQSLESAKWLLATLPIGPGEVAL